jgi:purine catabolism regulator
VAAGAAGLGRPVRWTHVAELPDIAHLLRGGELLLSTGLGFPADGASLTTFIEQLDDAGVAGLVVELGRRYPESLPPELLTAAESRELPVIELRRETPFVQVTESVHALIVGAQLAELRVSDEVHRTFTELSIEGAEPEAIVRQTARMANAPVVLENLSHQVLAFDPAGTSAEALLDRWESRSRSLQTQAKGRTVTDPTSGWVVATVGARGTDWGRLVLVLGGPASGRDLVLAERAAAALALGRLIEREHESLERQSHRTLLGALVDQSLTSHDIYLRAKGLGVPLEGKALVGVVLRPVQRSPAPLADQARLRRLAEWTADSLKGTRALGLVGVLDDATIGLLLVVSDPARVDATLDAISTRVRRNVGEADDEVVIAVGSTVGDVLEVRRSFLEAAQVADVAGEGAPRPFHRLADVGLSGLLHLLRRDERLQTFVERELGPLLAHDDANGTDLSGALRHYLEAGRNKSEAAAAFGVSRPAFYERLHAIERVLGVDLDDVATCLTLHVATAALAAVRSPG